MTELKFHSRSPFIRGRNICCNLLRVRVLDAYITGLHIQRAERLAAVLVEFAEKFDILKAAGMHIGTQCIDAQVKQVAHDKKHDGEHLGEDDALGHHGDQHVEHHTDDALAEAHTDQPHLEQNDTEPVTYTQLPLPTKA